MFTDLPATNRFVSEDELNVIKQGSVTVQKPSVDKSVWLRLLSHPALLTNYFAFFVFGYILYFMMTWLPSYLSQVDHLSLMNSYKEITARVSYNVNELKINHKIESFLSRLNHY